MGEEANKKFQDMKKAGANLSKENKKAHDVLRQKVAKLEAMGSKRDEYYDLVKKMLEENKDLQSQLGQAQSTIREQSIPGANTGALERQIRQVRQQTQQAEETAADPTGR